MTDNTLCKANIKVQISLIWKIILVALIAFTILWNVPSLSRESENYNLFGYYNARFWNSYYEKYKFMYGNNVPCSVSLILVILCILWTIRCIIVSRKCLLELTADGINGSRAKLFSNKNLQLPIDKIDNIEIKDGILDKLFGGKTVCIRTASGAVKFAWIQNAEEFVSATQEKMKEFKVESTKNAASSADDVTQVKTEASSTSVVQQIKELKELLDSEIISQEEFDAKKQELLSKM
ncbi:MAG: SHOCT domain-containing protein [Ruminococcus sp.]|nr:SHOCT domain-containing protein [Ruminococcus sp.]